MRPSDTYRGARRNAWRAAPRPKQWAAWILDPSTLTGMKRLYVPPVRLNRSKHLDGLPTLRELAIAAE